MKKSSAVCQFILSKEFAVGEEATVKTRIVNLLKGNTGKQIDFTATLSNISYEANSEEVLQVDFEKENKFYFKEKIRHSFIKKFEIIE